MDEIKTAYAAVTVSAYSPPTLVYLSDQIINHDEHCALLGLTGSLKSIKLKIIISDEQEQEHVDVTIGCEDGNISAHKVVLSSSSPYFRQRRYFSLCDQSIRDQSFGYESKKI